MDKAIKKAFEQVKEMRHPLHDIVDMINSTPMDMIHLKYEQNDDGSRDFHISIPSRAEQAKQKALQQAMQGEHNLARSPGSVDQIAEQEPQPVAAARKIEIKVAMTTADELNMLKAKYPVSFLKSMGM